MYIHSNVQKGVFQKELRNRKLVGGRKGNLLEQKSEYRPCGLRVLAVLGTKCPHSEPHPQEQQGQLGSLWHFVGKLRLYLKGSRKSPKNYKQKGDIMK